MSEDTNGAFVSTQSLSNKIWHWLGFYGRFNEALFDWRQDVPEGGDLITIRSAITVSWGDRLRILWSGKCELITYSKTTVPVGAIRTGSEFRVLP